MNKNDKLNNTLNLVNLQRLKDGIAILKINNPPLNLFTLEMFRTLD